MNAANWATMALDTLRQHFPPDALWIPIAVLTVIGITGLVAMLRGARYAPSVSGMAFALIGASVAPVLVKLLGTPLWPTSLLLAVVGVIVGVVMFRLWLAALVSLCFAGLGLGIYGAQSLARPIADYASRGLTPELTITLPAAASNGAAPVGDFSQLWAYLIECVPNLQASLLAIILSTGLAGLVFGLLFPRLARVVLAASVGTAMTLAAAYAIARLLWPAAGTWMDQWGATLAAVMWAGSILLNLVDLFRKPSKPSDGATAEPQPAHG